VGSRRSGQETMLPGPVEGDGLGVGDEELFEGDVRGARASAARYDGFAEEWPVQFLLTFSAKYEEGDPLERLPG